VKHCVGSIKFIIMMPLTKLSEYLYQRAIGENRMESKWREREREKERSRLTE
jgi:hypothetical protein